MGFDQRVAAKALYQTWEDPDAAVALLLGESTRDHTAEDVPDSEDEELARAVALSLGSPSTSGFVYGVHYPKPIIQPVSLTNTEEKEDEARKQQKRRDEQIASSKRRSGRKGKEFNRLQWEESRSQWPAETPTAASNKSGESGWASPPSKRGGESGQGGYSGKKVLRESGKESMEPGVSRRRWGAQKC